MKASTIFGKHFRRYRLWLGNIWIARAVFNQSPLRGLLGLYHMTRFVLSGKRHPDWRKRLRACYRCQHFNRERRTCGTANKFWENPMTGEFEQAGCLCSAALKGMDPHSQCWLAGATDGKVDNWANL